MRRILDEDSSQDRDSRYVRGLGSRDGQQFNARYSRSLAARGSFVRRARIEWLIIVIRTRSRRRREK